MPQPPENIWIAASDGHIDAVKDFIAGGVSPNAKDENTYTPMHAAASYGHIDLLDYLVQRGGDVNIADNDGDTPLYTVESIQVARWLIEHGADPAHRNREGLTPADHLSEDFPDVATYLLSLTHPGSRIVAPQVPGDEDSREQTQHFAGALSEEMTRTLLERAQALRNERPDMTDDEIERELVQLVGRTVLEGVTEGAAWAVQQDDTTNGPDAPHTNGVDGDSKRRRLE
ncbi:ankyrin [Exidia glandulosa HHB12029]|uniref:Ankyrin n=1 Tax=Exidia glandulosa HHB12029 TaxID=1314781 RepID=A0A165CU84_EXIGL|nr:ankyrin [Exidia glandulosa HHB12029]